LNTMKTMNSSIRVEEFLELELSEIKNMLVSSRSKEKIGTLSSFTRVELENALVRLTKVELIKIDQLEAEKELLQQKIDEIKQKF